jgi:hypothetical protein
MEITISTEVKESVNQALAEAEKMQVIEVSNQNEFEMTEAMLKTCRERIKTLDSERKSITGPIDNAKKAVMDFFKPVIEKWEGLEIKVNSARKIYLNKKEQERLDLERKIQADREAELKKAKKTGDKEKVNELKSTPAPVVQSSAVMNDNRLNRKTYKIRVLDMDTFLKWVIWSKQYGYITINETVIRAQAQANKGSIEIPGVEIKYEY